MLKSKVYLIQWHNYGTAPFLSSSCLPLPPLSFSPPPPPPSLPCSHRRRRRRIKIQNYRSNKPSLAVSLSKLSPSIKMLSAPPPTKQPTPPLPPRLRGAASASVADVSAAAAAAAADTKDRTK